MYVKITQYEHGKLCTYWISTSYSMVITNK